MLEDVLRERFGEPTVGTNGVLRWYGVKDPGIKSHRLIQTEMHDGSFNLRLDPLPIEAVTQMRARQAEVDKMPRVSSHDLARRLLALPDCDARILWGSYEHPVEFEVMEDGILFYG